MWRATSQAASCAVPKSGELQSLIWEGQHFRLPLVAWRRDRAALGSGHSTTVLLGVWSGQSFSGCSLSGQNFSGCSLLARAQAGRGVAVSA